MPVKREDRDREAMTDAHAIGDDMLRNASLEALQGGEQRKIMDVVDKLRRTGLDTVLQLPQLVVCGDQSSGKSSVLEAITEIPFPRKENLCTRFATEIVMRRDPVASIATKINPDKARPKDEQDKLSAFHKSIEDFSELPDLIEEATELMGLNATTKGQAKAFSKDVLSIEITGPGRPQLTLVDLPGLIHSQNKSQSAEDVKLIHELVEEYISNERTIILAVISAKNDYANQIILKKAQMVDPKGNRTLGIITKPDFLRSGSENERDWIALAQNKDVYFKLGWHMLKNRGDGEQGGFEERNAAETAFFNKGSYAELDRSVLGIETLRSRLSRTLSDHLRKELPGLKKELDKKLQETDRQLILLGDSRANIGDQKAFLTDLGSKALDLFKSAVDGHYKQSFFRKVNTLGRIDEAVNIKRLRAVIQALNIEFARRMRLTGRKFTITDDSGNDLDEEAESKSHDMMVDGADADESYESDSKGMNPHSPLKMTRAQAIEWVVRVQNISRGSELPGNFNPMLIGELFWEQSAPWEQMALDHIRKVADVTQIFVGNVLTHIATEDVESRLQTVLVEATLKNALTGAEAELRKIIADKLGDPITYNHYYTTTIQKTRRQKQNKVFKKLATKSTQGKPAHPFDYNDSEKQKVIDPATLERMIDSQVELDMDRFSAEEALDCMMAFYKQELKYFIDVVTKQVVERHLVKPLPQDVLSPVVIAKLDDEAVHYIAAEPADITERRAHLEGRQKMLRDGQETFRKAIGSLRF